VGSTPTPASKNRIRTRFSYVKVFVFNNRGEYQWDFLRTPQRRGAHQSKALSHALLLQQIRRIVGAGAILGKILEAFVEPFVGSLVLLYAKRLQF
jgi:hypothetical protein